MPFELAGRCEFTQLVPYHELSDIHRDELITVVDREGVSDEIGTDRGTTTPGLDHAFLRFSFIHAHHLFFEVSSDVRTFFDRTSHMLFLFVYALITWKFYFRSCAG